ncbi:FAD-dependent oxidoreductase [Thomasclavelia sp.]|uniref:FAD-dependent oxidoreductase n=1 Tax=Thomasclavelia sp. TaxID=3025757 RepID=UPI0025E13FE5|nr:FAD-dependent oxidoreductase [Thomasclavelia sp.]
MEDVFKPLFEPMKIGNVEIKNKFFMAPMATIVMTDENQCYTPQSIDYYVERAKGGVGLIITGANWVDNDIEPHAPSSFPCPNKLPILYTKMAREMTDRVHAYDTKIFLQLTAGLGRSALPNFVAPSDFVAPSKTTNRWLPNVECRELKTEEIEKIVKDFGSAALVAKESGFDGVEIHAVHEGYLLDCFTMSLFNQRTDKYGGDLKGRLTFAIEIVQEIKNKCGQDFPVVLRFSIKSYIKALRQGGLPGEEFEELGRDVDEAIEAIKILQEAGYDAFDADAGTYDSWYWAHPPMYFNKGMYLPLAKQIQGASKVPVMVAGRMDDPQMAVQALNDGIIDAVGLGRPLLTDPDYVNKLKTNKAKNIRPCLGCHDGCFGRLLQHGLGSCAVNPECGRESLVGIKKAETKKKVVVVGGGPGGMEAARVSAIRGHDVTLIEANDSLGGALRIAGVPDFKEDDRDLIKWYATELEELGVNVKLNTKATKEMLEKMNPDAIFVSEGSSPVVPKIDGVENAALAQDVMLEKVPAENNIVVIGGGLVGCELALHLAKQGKNVTIVEALPDILKSGAPLPPMNEFMLRDLLAFHDVKIKANQCVTAIKPDSVTLTDEIINCNQVILAVGYRSNHTLYDQIKYDYPEVFNVGDSRDVRNIRGAIWDSYEVARNL